MGNYTRFGKCVCCLSVEQFMRLLSDRYLGMQRIIVHSVDSFDNFGATLESNIRDYPEILGYDFGVIVFLNLAKGYALTTSAGRCGYIKDINMESVAGIGFFSNGTDGSEFLNVMYANLDGNYMHCFSCNPHCSRSVVYEFTQFLSAFNDMASEIRNCVNNNTQFRERAFGNPGLNSQLGVLFDAISFKESEVGFGYFDWGAEAQKWDLDEVKDFIPTEDELNTNVFGNY